MFNLAGDTPVKLQNVRIKNIDLSNQTGQRGTFDINAAISRLELQNVEFAFETVTGMGSNKYKAVNGGGSNTVGVFRAESCDVTGAITTNRATREFFNAFSVDVASFGVVTDCTFDRLDQYCTFLNANGEGATVIVSDNASLRCGNGDQFRAGSKGNGEIVKIEGNTVSGTANTADVGADADIHGDRGIIIQGTGTTDAVTVADNTVRGVLVGFDIQRGVRSLIVEGNHIYNCGHYDTANQSRPGILSRTNVRNNGFVKVNGNHVINETVDRAMEPGIEVRETDGNSTEDATVTENSVKGYETNGVVVAATTQDVRDNTT
ncbi:hypothetical protein [Halorussus marinus]|uniref:hypothetical protein n=1 Tax=Halorussus marinus TaxID=2505976 RepID=UPI001092338A|nr:hypothetical protein [Halorussus marinus]